EKCSFDDPEYRREIVMKHAQWLFRDARSKLKRKYFNDISDGKLKEKSKKASESRAHQKVPHYDGTKSFARLRQEIVFASRTRKSKKVVNALTLEKNTLAVDEIKKLKEQRDQDVLGKDTHGYLKAYGPDKLIEEARIDAKNARIETEKVKNRSRSR
ncbi:hypothetical protein RDABS01_003804, partial [Bienertia sinuspersici]